jgi:hypothetical protein
VVVGEGQLDPVETALATAPGGVAEGADQHGDLLRLQHVRDLPVDLLRDLGRGQEDVPALAVRLGPAAEVRELAEDRAVVAVHGLGQGPVGGDDRVVVVGDQVHSLAGDEGGRSDRDDGEATPPGPGLVVGAEPDRLPVLGHGLGVAGGKIGSSVRTDAGGVKVTEVVGHHRTLLRTII